MNDAFLETRLRDCERIAREAGTRILRIYGTDFEVRSKSDASPLTAADLASHRTIVQGLEALTPALPVLSEESAQAPYRERASWERYWLIDPLDGTREFIQRNDEFTVNIALIQDHKAILGVVYAPALDLLYSAAQGHGAYKNGRPIEVTRPCTQPPRIVSSRSHAGDLLDRYLKKLGRHSRISMGSSLKLCLVAEGAADLYPRLGPTSEWDSAAAQAVVEQAGGHVTDRNLKPLLYNTRETLLNPHFFVFGDHDIDWSRYV